MKNGRNTQPIIWKDGALECDHHHTVGEQKNPPAADGGGGGSGGVTVAGSGTIKHDPCPLKRVKVSTEGSECKSMWKANAREIV